MFLTIAIVEDEAQLHSYYAKMIEAWGKARNVRLNITFVENAEEYLFKYDGHNPFDILFLDVCMKEMNGMELARRIRTFDRRVQIVFLTGKTEFVFEGYEIGAVRYLVKPVEENELVKALDACMEKLAGSRADYLTIKYHGENLRISRSDIVSVKVDGHYLKMQTMDNGYEWKASLKEMMDKLDSERFVMANRSVIVNLEFVKKITREECFLENGETIPVSRGAYGPLNEAFMKYFF